MNKVLYLVLIIVMAGCTGNQKWNQYLGPERNAKSGDDGADISWAKSEMNKLWEVKTGPGYGGASIADNEVFLLDRIQGEADVLRCFDLESGREKWNFQYPAEGEIPYPGSRTVPYVDKDYVWSVGPHGDFYCISRQSQKPVWNNNLGKMYKAERPNWGFSQSPLVYNDLVIVAPQGSLAGVVAFNKYTGEEVWKSRPLTGYNFHVSPVLGNFGGIDQVIVISPYDRQDSTKLNEVAAFDAKTGDELWKYHGLRSFATITPATVVDENRLFLTDCSYNGSYSPVSILLEINRSESGFEVTEVFKTEEAGCKMHPAVYHEGYFYLNNNGRPGGMTCISENGEVMWEKGSAPDFELGGLIMVDGVVINQNGKNGDIHLAEPSPEGYKELAKLSFFDSSKSQAWSPLAYANGNLLVRDMEKLVCVKLK